MTEERIITATVITSGEKPDGAELKRLIEKSKATGMVIDEILCSSRPISLSRN